jgi:hypothetical protein
MLCSFSVRPGKADLSTQRGSVSRRSQSIRKAHVAERKAG